MKSEPSASDPPQRTERAKSRSGLYTPPSSRPKGPLSRYQRQLVAISFFCFRFYMALVRLTSRVDTSDLETLWGPARGGKNAISAIMHQDVIISAFLYRGKRIVSMVSTSQDGDRIAQVAHKLGHDIVRGSGAQRGRQALGEMIDYLETREGVVAALTIDGSRGPVGVCKKGILHLAQQSGVPIVPIRTWSRRSFLLKTWDRTQIPLPFSRIVAVAGEPIFIERDAHPDQLEEARLNVEGQLRELTERAHSRANR